MPCHVTKIAKVGAASPDWAPGTFATYHAVAYSFIVGGIVDRVFPAAATSAAASAAASAPTGSAPKAKAAACGSVAEEAAAVGNPKLGGSAGRVSAMVRDRSTRPQLYAAHSQPRAHGDGGETPITSRDIFHAHPPSKPSLSLCSLLAP